MVLDSHWVEWGALKSVGTLGHTGRYGGGVGPHLRSESRDTVHIEVLWELGEYCEYVSVTEVNDRNEVGGGRSRSVRINQIMYAVNSRYQFFRNFSGSILGPHEAY